MPDYAVHITIINQTSEHFDQDPDGTSANLGHWVDLPQTIQAHSKAVFQIADDAGLWGSDANNAFFVKTNIDDKSRAQIHTYACCPYLGGSNKFEPEPIEPKSVYVASFRAKSGSGDWQDNSVPSKGSPVWVEYTIKHQSKRYHFTLVKLAAESDHPIRNSRDELITGFHTLWSSDSASKWADGERGSYAPNVFAYKSGSVVAEHGHIDVTVRALDPELIGAEVIVYGSIDGNRILQTDYFFVKNLNNTVLTAHVVEPASSKKPFNRNADIVWAMELRQSGMGVEAIGPNTTRLELYWICKTTHPAFWNGLPIGFLRSVFSRSSAHTRVKRDDEDNLMFTNSDWYKAMTEDVFGAYSKRYDTCNGASAFNMTVWGGIFAEAYYRAAAPGSDDDGTLYRTVNCFDQAGMLELCCSLDVSNIHFTSWLLQQPFGYIKTTKLVGIGNGNDGLIDVNNPFFGTDQSRALVGNNDAGRTRFHCHVYVGYSKPFDRTNDAIYDACAKPHTGNENAAAYLAASRQDETETELYATNNTYPGRVDTIQEGNGVTGIDGQPYQAGGPVAHHISRAANVLTKVVGAPPASFNIAITHVDWAHVDTWVSDVLGGEWSVPFKTITASEGSARAFWHLSGTDNASVRINVTVESVVTEDGNLDVQRSAAAARNRAADLLLTTERNPEEIWTRGELDEYGDYSYQYLPDIGAGRIVVSAANTVVDIAGDVSTAALKPTAHRLLERVVRRNADVPALPTLRRGRTVALSVPHEGGSRHLEAHVSPYDPNNHTVNLQHTNSRLTLEFDIDREISIAGASSQGGKVLFDKYTIDASGEQPKVRFVLVPRESGTHAISLHVADDKTMVSTTHVVNIHVE
ncbi:hypothetical protein AAE478_003757 [Parahypoxylon ruwenzoriense]